MGLAQNFEKEKLIIGFIYNTEENYEKALKIMVDKFGAVDFETEEFHQKDFPLKGRFPQA